LKSKYLNIVVFFLITSFFSNHPVLSQVTQKSIIFDHYGKTQGFVGSQALAIKKAKNGFIWIGTEQGLMRYDGHTFKTFRANPLDTTAISSNYINQIIEDKHGRLWLFALPDINVFDPETGVFKKINLPLQFEKGGKLRLYRLKYDRQGDITWVCTNGGLFYSQGKDINIQKLDTDNAENIDYFSSMEIDKDGNYWLIGTEGIVKFNPISCVSSVFHNPEADPKIVDDDGFLSSYYDKKSNILWIGHWVYGLMKFDMVSEKMVQFVFADRTKFQNAVTRIDKSNIPGEDDLLWLGTNYGLKAFNTSTNKFMHYSTDDFNDLHGVPGAAFCFESTESEGMWIGTFKGLHRYDPFKQNVQYLKIPLPNGASNWALSNMSIEKNNRGDSIMWFGISYNSIFKYDLVNKKLALVPQKLREYCNNVDPFSIFIDSQNILWISSDQKGFVGYDLLKNIFVNPVFKISAKESIPVFHFEEDHDHNLWLGSTKGLFFYDRSKNEIYEQKEIFQFLELNNFAKFFYNFTIDEVGNIWCIIHHKIDKKRALLLFEPVSKKIEIFTQSEYAELQIMKELEQVKYIGDNKIIVTSYNGFSVINTAVRPLKFNLFDHYNSKPIGGLSSTCRDNSGHVWISTDNGVLKFDPKENSISDFSFYNSLMGLTPHPDLTISKNSNILYIGQDQALNFIQINKLKIPDAGKVLLSDLHIFNYKLEKIPASGQTIELKHNQNSFEFEFTNLNFTDSQNNTYQYTLSNNEEDWKNMNNNNKLTFNNLGYGEYVLRVRGKNSFGVNNKSEFTLYLNIEPPFWRSWWFNLVIIGCISFGIYQFFKYRELQRQKLDKLRHNLARDLHDDMGSTLSHIRMMSEREAMRSDDNQTFKNIATKTAEVMSNMTEIIWSINPINDSLINIVDKIQEFAIDTLEPAGIDVFFEVDKVPESIKLNAESRRHLFLIFKEAINNAAKYSKASSVTFSLKVENKKITVSLLDNGLGFDPLLIKYGNGLKNMENRAKALNAKIDIKTSGNGTSISLYL
jgi:ligand-binding sensor domain-containing protein/two-component sensor histidine kinase